MNMTAVLQIIVAFGLLNVWLLRNTKETEYRGGTAKNLKEEFIAYGLPVWFYYTVGVLKTGAAIALLVGLWISSVTLAAASLVVFLMLGALAMHLKAKDPIRKSVPALIMLAMSVAIVVSNTRSSIV